MKTITKKSGIMAAIFLVGTTTLLSIPTYAKQPFGAYTCNGTEINIDGSFNKENFINEMGYGNKSADWKRTISLDQFFSMPRAMRSKDRISTVEMLTHALNFHALAENFGLAEITKGLVKTNDRIPGFSYKEIQARLSRSYKVVVNGSNSAKLVCQQFSSGPEISVGENYYSEPAYINVGRGGIASPLGQNSFACKLTGSWKDMAPNLFKVLSEAKMADTKDTKIMDDELAKYEAGSQARSDAFPKIYTDFWDRINAHIKLFEKSVPGISGIMGLKTSEGQAVIASGRDNCAANLVCTINSCRLIDNAQLLDLLPSQYKTEVSK